MPLSIIIELKHDFRLPSQHFGRQIQGWFFDTLKRIDPNLADRMHAPNVPPAYTLSTPFISRRGDNGNHGKPSNLSFLRLTILDDAVVEFFQFEFLPQIQNHIQVLWMDFLVGGYIYRRNLNQLAGFMPYALLSDEYANRAARKVKLNFVSPTVFRSGEMDIPLPDPIRVYSGLYHSWNAFAPEEINIATDWLDFAEKALVVNRIYQIKTERLPFAGGLRGAATGFVGEIDYSLLPARKLPQHLQVDYAKNKMIFSVLSAYAFYCGVGARTTIGMGQTYPHID